MESKLRMRFFSRLAGFARFAVLLLSYAGILFLSLLIAFLMRFDFQVPMDFWPRFWVSAAWIVPLKIIFLGLFGQFRSLLTYFSLPDFTRVAGALGGALVVEVLLWYATFAEEMIPRGVIASDFVLSLFGLAGFRFALRIFREQVIAPKSTGSPHAHWRRVAIVGAGSAGAALLRDIQSRPGLGIEVVCFVDDDRIKIGSRLHGKPILGPTRNIVEFAENLEIKKVVLAMPSAKPAAIKRLVSKLNEADLDHDILPSVDQLLNRKVTVEHLRHVSPEDLLGREPAKLDDSAIGDFLCNRVVMVTGAGGSIGSELCRQIASHKPARLILLDRSEPALFQIERELIKDFSWVETVSLAASICNQKRINAIFKKYSPDYVFHAAAHKHVPLMESQPAEAILNNAVGTLTIGMAAAENRCQRFVLVSTDKAVNPTNVMGASKRLAELVVNGLQHKYSGSTSFCSVRFGNVLGSSGSVIPIFRQQIASGGPVTVTHPDVVRYFMSIPESVGLILQSATMARGGDVFVLDMGEPVRIQDLAQQMIELFGFVPDEDIKIHFTGLRPGEKLFEEPIHTGENIQATSHSKIHRLINGLQEDQLLQDLNQLAEGQLYTSTVSDLKAWLSAHVPEYRIWIE